jgi:hypothetical protein
VKSKKSLKKPKYNPGHAHSHKCEDCGKEKDEDKFHEAEKRR